MMRQLLMAAFGQIVGGSQRAQFNRNREHALEQFVLSSTLPKHVAIKRSILITSSFLLFLRTSMLLGLLPSFSHSKACNDARRPSATRPDAEIVSERRAT
jgi:hypothetical protein